MIGFYDYTVILTYLSLLSAVTGIAVCLHGIGHPFYGVFFLLFSGLCDTFDGKVARTKKNRTAEEKAFGVQIDSLSDLVAFGVLPGCIGLAMVRLSVRFTDIPYLSLFSPSDKRVIYPIIFYVIMLVYALAAMIRLAYFNVTEETRQKTENGSRKYYTGLPVTSAALIFPTIMLIQFLTKTDLTIVYFVVMVLTSILFVSNIRVKKPQNKGIFIMVGIGVVEAVLLAVVRHYLHLR